MSFRAESEKPGGSLQEEEVVRADAHLVVWLMVWEVHYLAEGEAEVDAPSSDLSVCDKAEVEEEVGEDH